MTDTQDVKSYVLGIFIFLGLNPAARAGFGADLSGSAQMGQFSSANLSDNSIYLYELAMGYGDKVSGFSFSFVYTGLSGNVYTSAGTNTYSGSLAGGKVHYSHPKFRWMLVAATYYPSASVSEQTPSTSSSHTGSAIEYEAGFNIPFKGNWAASLKLCYYSLNLNTITGGVTSSQSYPRNFVFPTATLRYGF